MSGKETMLILNMFSGIYSEDHIAHEIINLFLTDDGKSFIYAPHDGKPTKSCKDVKKVLMLRYLGNGRYEVLARARVSKCLTTNVDQQCALEHMLYSGQPFKSIMKTVDQPFSDNERITFEAASCERPVNDIFIQCERCDLVADGLEEPLPNGLLAYRTIDGSQQDIYLATGMRKDGSLDLLVQHQRRFIDSDRPLYEKLDKLFEKDSKEFDWVPVTKAEGFETTPLVSDARFLALLNKEESELAYSNMLAHFIDENQIIARAFIELLLDRLNVKPSSQDMIPYEILREKHHIDILINTHDRVFIIENKVHAGLSKDDNKCTGATQLDKYAERIAVLYPNRKQHAFILCPNFNELLKATDQEPVKVRGNVVPIISYTELYAFLSQFKTVKGGDDENRYYQDFLAMLRWQTKDHQKDLSARYMNLSMKRFLRAIEIDKALHGETAC